jgi:hypothetical protein
VGSGPGIEEGERSRETGGRTGWEEGEGSEKEGVQILGVEWTGEGLKEESGECGRGGGVRSGEVGVCHTRAQRSMYLFQMRRLHSHVVASFKGVLPAKFRF